jgi:hypothetical protein
MNPLQFYATIDELEEIDNNETFVRFDAHKPPASMKSMLFEGDIKTLWRGLNGEELDFEKIYLLTVDPGIDLSKEWHCISSVINVKKVRDNKLPLWWALNEKGDNQ